MALTQAKGRLRLRIAAHRAECAAQVARVARPLRWIDGTVAWWRRLTPLTKLATVPLSWWLTRRVARPGLLARLVRWGPALFGFARAFTGRPGR